jgi:hypothetical protein
VINNNNNNNNNLKRSSIDDSHGRERTGACIFLVGKPETERQKSLGRPRPRWEITLK